MRDIAQCPTGVLAARRWWARAALLALIASQLLGCQWVFPYNATRDPDRSTGDARLEGPRSEAGPISGLLDLSVGAGHACAVKLNGELWCWGWNEWGQLGLGNTTSAASPQRSALVGVTSVSAGVNHTCALAAGTVYCWGYNGNGHLGIGSKASVSKPQPTKPMASKIVEVGTGKYHTCARDGSGAVWCWGANSEVGVSGEDVEIPQPVKNACPAKRIALGYFHSCALCADRTVQCWGQNDHGQLGDGKTISRSTPGPVKGVGNVRRLWAGAMSTCVERDPGEIACWGFNSHGQVDGAAGGTSPITEAVSVSIPDKVVEMALGERHTCALVGGGQVYCWGSNLLGQLGDGSSNDGPLKPQLVPTLGGVIRISGVSHTTCASGSGSNEVWCWGSNGRGQVGNGKDGNVLLPYRLEALPSTAIDVDAGERHTCAVLEGGTVHCWGENPRGQAGSDWHKYVLPEPKLVPMKWLAKSVSAGYKHTCAVTESKEAVCWGENESGQLGDGATTSRSQPALVRSASAGCEVATPMMNVVAVAAGASHTCMSLNTREVFCTGSNSLGQLGDPASSLASACPKVVGVNGEALAVGDTTSCVLTGAELVCWGTFGSWSSNGLAKVAAIAGTGPLSIGRDHGCLVSAGAALCWGASSHDRLGNQNATLVPSMAARVLDDKDSNPLVGVTSVGASPGVELSGHHSCAVAGGAVYCWGWNASGQLGDGTTSARPKAVAVGAPLKATKITTGSQHSCAIDDKKQVWCWGYNGGGAVGGELPVVRKPFQVQGL